jgi:hypothetical protein
MERFSPEWYAEYTPGPAKEITEERFLDMLNCLPPSRWIRGADVETFHVCERLTENYVSWFIRIGDQYFECVDDATVDRSVVIEKAVQCSEQPKEAA